MIIRHLSDLDGTDRETKAATFNARRLLLARDGLGYSFHDTVLYAGEETYIWYKNHQETVYCIEGRGTLTDHTNDEVHQITPGFLYVLDEHEKHTLKVEEDLRMICVFTPALVGQEVHDEEGAYPLLDPDEAEADT